MVLKNSHTYSQLGVYNFEVREALLDVCNLSHQNYAIAFEGNNPYFKLVGQKNDCIVTVLYYMF